MTKSLGDSLGDYLKKERESRQVSIEAMAGAIRISGDLIKALEGNRFDTFSQPELILGYLKLYSNHLGLDHHEVLKRADGAYKECRLQQNLRDAKPFLTYNSPLHQASKKILPETLRRCDRAMKKAALGVFVVLLISLLFFIPSEYKGPAAIRSDDLNKTSAGVFDEYPISTPVVGNSLPVTTISPAVQAPVLSKGPQQAKIIGNQDSKRYHLPGMKYYHRVHAYHRVVFDSEEEALRAGYRKAPR